MLYSVKLMKVFGLLLDAWHEPSVHQSYPPVLGNHETQHLVFTTAAGTYLAHA